MKRGGKVYTKVVGDTKTETLMPLITRKIEPGTFVYQQQPDPSAPTLTVIVELALGDLEVMAP